MIRHRRAGHGIIIPTLALLAASGAAWGQTGPDVITGDLAGPTKWGTIGGVTSYSIGTTSCNVGTQRLDWIELSNRHPVIAQNIYRLHNGRFEQVGQSWLKHSFCALQQFLCGSCQPSGGGCESTLGVGCSDPYTAARNGSQARLGPRYDVNAATGQFTWPFPTRNQTGDTLYKRIQVRNSDLDPANYPGALFFGEGQYVALDDATAGNKFNNASYKRINLGPLSGGGYTLSFTGAIARTSPAILAWKNHGGGIGIPDNDVIFQNIDVPGDGRFHVAYKVSDNGNGTWHYEIAIHNLNSHRSGGSLTVPIPAGVNVTNVGFHDINYHSGEPFDNTDWTMTVGPSSVSWTSPAPFAINSNSNALRWGTMYNFRFDASTGPASGAVTLGLFRPGTPSSVDINLLIPSAPPPPACPCNVNGDGVVNSQDFFDFLASFFAGDIAADFNDDGIVNSQDFFDFLACFFSPPAGC